MPRLPTTSFFELPPDWLCEVLSPSTARVDRAKKMRHYATARVQHVWLLDPLATTLEVFRLEAAGWLLVGTHASDEKVRAVPFDAVELELATLWEPR